MAGRSSKLLALLLFSLTTAAPAASQAPGLAGSWISTPEELTIDLDLLTPRHLSATTE